jgi:acetolactate synthase small subunit
LPQQTKRATRSSLRVRLTRLVNIAGAKRVDASSQTYSRESQVQPRARNVKVRMVKDVEDLRPKFEIGSFIESESLVKNQIQLIEVWTTQRVAGDIAKGTRCRSCKAAG